MSHIFISYAREDRSIAQRLAKSLEREGWSVWWDTQTIQAGEPWDEVIERELGAAQCVIALLSANSVRSHWILEEASYARDRSTLVLAMLESVPLPLGFRSIHSIDLSGWEGQKLHPGFQRLIRVIRDFVEQRREAGTSIASPYVSDLAVFRDIDALWCPELVSLPTGIFLMGSQVRDVYGDESEMPQHRVTIGYRFAVARYPTTFNEYDYFAEATARSKPRDEDWGRGRRPVVNVSWLDAKAYVAWLSQATSVEYSLLTEAEWEYACRAGTQTAYAFGDTITEKDANFGGIIGKTSEVGTYPPNACGLYDMHGNVWEWVEDIWHSNYTGAPTNGLAWIEGDDREIRVSRGGSWINALEDLRSACRGANTITNAGGSLGFRVARRL